MLAARVCYVLPAQYLTPPPLSCHCCSFQWREQCHKCGHEKPADAPDASQEPEGALATAGGYGGGGGGGYGGGMQGGMAMRPGDWRCISCANVK